MVLRKNGARREKASKGVNINQKYSYALAVKLTAKEIAQPKLTLGTVTPGLRNYRKVVLATIRNPEPAVVSQLKLTTKVTRKGSSKVLYQNSSDNLIMAPNSNFTYPTFLDDQVMRAGDYTLSVTATTNDSKWAKKLGIGPGTLRLRLNKHVKIIKKPRMTRPPPSVSGGTS
ncbi:DUF3324 domain-containing protein [Lactiplantibacillus plantarum]|nr:DUF3324 domain-containing protein [Lactiplantibacillus plantarum]